MIRTIGLVMLCMTMLGCASERTKTYFDIGVGYQLNNLSDPWYEIRDVGQPWVFQGEIGIEIKDPRWYECGQIGWQHESRLLDGGPFNRNPELHREMVVCSKKFGGF